jgi:hypothetical protein
MQERAQPKKKGVFGKMADKVSANLFKGSKMSSNMFM